MNDRDYDFNAIKQSRHGTTTRKVPSHGNSGMYLKRKKQQKKRNLFLALAVAILVSIVLLIVLLCRSCSDGSEARITGTYSLDANTVYIFDSDDNGTLKTGTANYTFTYTVKDDVLFIDYATDALTDCEYTFTVDKDTLVLEGGKGTVGGTYTLTKND